jgi:DNA-binding NarL/FixJ family response regulator
MTARLRRGHLMRIDDIPKSRDITDVTRGDRGDDSRMPWTVLIVDDHAGFRHFARGLLEADGFTVVGEAADGEEALVAADQLRPELVLLDIMLPGIDGFAVAERLAAVGHPPAVVLTSSCAAHDLGERLGQTTARGFIRKDDLTGVALARLAGFAP